MSSIHSQEAGIYQELIQSCDHLSSTKDDEFQEKLLEENLKLVWKLHHLESQLMKQASLNDRQNNTSSAFELPSEFKSKWETLVTDMIIDAFGEFFSEINIIVPLVQFSLRATYKVISDELKSKMTNVIQLFNLKTDDKT